MASIQELEISPNLEVTGSAMSASFKNIYEGSLFPFSRFVSFVPYRIVQLHLLADTVLSFSGFKLPLLRLCNLLAITSLVVYCWNFLFVLNTF